MLLILVALDSDIGQCGDSVPRLSFDLLARDGTVFELQTCCIDCGIRPNHRSDGP